jgi:hypothetical protein
MTTAEAIRLLVQVAQHLPASEDGDRILIMSVPQAAIHPTARGPLHENLERLLDRIEERGVSDGE